MLRYLISHLKGVLQNLDRTLDSEFYCLKCFVLKSCQEPSTILNLFGFFVILCSPNSLQAIATVETMKFRIPCFIKILRTPLGDLNVDTTTAYTQFHRMRGVGEVNLSHLWMKHDQNSYSDKLVPADSISEVKINKRLFQKGHF